MTNLFEGMLLWEIILLSLGVVLFLTFIGGFIYLLRKDKLKMSYGGFFFIPIVMIAFPSIRSASFWNGLVEIETLTNEIEENPDATDAIKELEERISKQENAPIRTEEQLETKARANVVLEHYDVAEEQAEEILKKDPENEVAIIVKARVSVIKAQEALTKDATNEKARKKEETNIKILKEQTKIPQIDKILIRKSAKFRKKN